MKSLLFFAVLIVSFTSFADEKPCPDARLSEQINDTMNMVESSCERNGGAFGRTAALSAMCAFRNGNRNYNDYKRTNESACSYAMFINNVKIEGSTIYRND